MKNKHLLVGRELGRKKWTLKIGAINVAIFGKYAADFGFLALVTLVENKNKSRQEVEDYFQNDLGNFHGLRGRQTGLRIPPDFRL